MSTPTTTPDDTSAPHTVILGGTSGIGLATAEHLLALGHTVTIAGRNPTRLDNALAALDSPRAHGRTTDVRNRADLDALFTDLDAVDHLVVTVTAAGGAGAFTALGLDAVGDALDGKTLAHLNAVQAAVPHLREGGSVTLVTAGSANSVLPGTVGLAAVNGALEAAVPVLALELAPLRVNAVSPGIIDTAWWDWVPAEQRAETLAGFAAGIAVGRVGRAEEVADAIAFLIGNAFTTGVVLPVDGGGRLKP